MRQSGSAAKVLMLKSIDVKTPGAKDWDVVTIQLRLSCESPVEVFRSKNLPHSCVQRLRNNKRVIVACRSREHM